MTPLCNVHKRGVVQKSEQFTQRERSIKKSAVNELTTFDLFKINLWGAYEEPMQLVR